MSRSFPRFLTPLALATVIAASGSLCLAGSDMAKVARVLDGNTLVLNRGKSEEIVRLIGVVTPGAADSQVEARNFGEKARLFLAEFVKDGWVMVEYDAGGKSVDAEGRSLVYLYRGSDAAFINDRLLAEGYGVARTKKDSAYANSFNKAQQKAMRSQRGLWGEGGERSAKWGTQSVSGQPVYLGEGYSADRQNWVYYWVYTIYR